MAWIRQPRTTKSGTGGTYSVGYVDHDGKQRTKGGFPDLAAAEKWRDRCTAQAAEGPDALEQFLRKERCIRRVEGVPGAGAATEDESPPVHELTVHQLFQAWFEQDAHPDADEGLAPATYNTYRDTYNRHIRPRVGDWPAKRFELAVNANALRRVMREDKVGQPTQRLVLAVFSSALSWAVDEDLLQSNGVRKSPNRNRRRSSRQTNHASTRRRAKGATPGDHRLARALTPPAVARITMALVAPKASIAPASAMQDIVWTLSQYCLGLRNQEVHGIRLSDAREARYEVSEVVSYGELADTKTGDGAPEDYRSVAVPSLLSEVLDDWAKIVEETGGDPTGFVIPGDHAEGHLTLDQAKQWGRKRFGPACSAAAAGEFSYLAWATPYSLRRGHISARLRLGDDPAVVARECGTSLEMLYKHYQGELRSFEPSGGALDNQLREALDQAAGRTWTLAGAYARLKESRQAVT